MPSRYGNASGAPCNLLRVQSVQNEIKGRGVGASQPFLFFVSWDFEKERLDTDDS